MVLDLIFAGSLTAAGIQKLHLGFLAISLVTLAWRIGREGFSRSNIRRAVICASLLAWSQYNQRVQVAESHHNCH
jgi:hypothetical protein